MEVLNLILTIILACLFGYLVGSIPTAILFAKARGIDIRQYGSHNAGGTNVGRVIGKKQGIEVILLDMLKCFLPCLIIALILTYAPLSLPAFEHTKELLVSLTAIAVCLGHTFPIFAGFKGGKAVACFAGYIVFTAPLLALVGIIVFFTTFALSKRVSLSSILGVPSVLLASLIPLSLDLTICSDVNTWNGGMYFGPYFFLHLSYITTITIFLLTLLVIIRHLSNIERLKHGTEAETHFRHKGEKAEYEEDLSQAE